MRILKLKVVVRVVVAVTNQINKYREYIMGAKFLRLTACAALALCVSGLTAARAEEAAVAAAPKSVTTAEVASQAGVNVKVCGMVADARYLGDSNKKLTFLNFTKPYPDHDFTVIILPENRTKFAEAPELMFKGKKVCVTGVVRIMRGKAEIEVTDPAQIVIQAEAAPAK